MKSITIHNLDDDLEENIIALAKKQDLSLNKTIKKLLRESMGLSSKKPTKKADFSDIAGTWTKEEAEEFEKNIAEFSQIDEEDWR